MEEQNKPSTDGVEAEQSRFNIFSFIKREFTNLFSLSFDTDETGTIENIHKSIEFKGGNLWGLLFAAVIASIGLNMNSTAVIIGAMLISPLMGPILGVGYSVATNEFNTLKSSIRNLVISMVVAIVTAFIYFLISPINTFTPELEARTFPTLYDVMIAICGGGIGIVASSRKDRGNAIPGVAIATALMPPLCTVGYGLAQGMFYEAFGALYLFFINSVFIALTTYIFVRALRFPKKEFIDAKIERRYRQIILVVAIGTILPSIMTAYYVVRQEIFNSRATQYIDEVVKVHQFDKGVLLVDAKPLFSSDSSKISLKIWGNVSDEDKVNLQVQLKNYGLGDASIDFGTNAALNSYDGAISKELAELQRIKTEIIDKLYDGKEELLEERNKRIAFLETELTLYKTKYLKNSKPVDHIAKEFVSLYPDVENFSYNELYKLNVETQLMDTIPTVVLHWPKKRKIKDADRARLVRFFKTRMDLDTMEVVIY